VRNEEVLQRVKEERNMLQTIKRMKANWIGYILCTNCLIKHLFWRKKWIEVTGRRGTRCKQLLDDRKETRRYCKLEEEALDRTWSRTRFGRGHGPVVRQTTERSNKRMNERTKPVFLKSVFPMWLIYSIYTRSVDIFTRYLLNLSSYPVNPPKTER